MNQIVNDGTLDRGSIDITIVGYGTYTFLNFDDDGAQVRTELDYDKYGKPAAASHAEGFRMLSGVIRARTDLPAPPKFVTFAYDSGNFYIKNRRYTGSTEGLKEYAVEIQQQVANTLTVT